MMKVDIQSWKEDLRKLGTTLIIGAMTGLFLQPHCAILSVALLLVLGLVFWYLGLRRGEHENLSD